MSFARRLAAEGIGTALLVGTVVGSGVMADTLTADTGMALLANTIATGAMLFVVITLFAPISGAHLNPAVTVAFALRKDIDWNSSIAYILAQVLGGITGSILAHLMFDLPAWQLATHVRTGPSQWLSEGVATFGLILVIFGGARVRRSAIPALVALYITAAYWFTASTSFANPAVTMARALSNTFSGIRPVDAPAFILSQFVGAFLAMALGSWLFAASDAEVTPQ